MPEAAAVLPPIAVAAVIPVRNKAPFVGRALGSAALTGLPVGCVLPGRENAWPDGFVLADPLRYTALLAMSHLPIRVQGLARRTLLAFRHSGPEGGAAAVGAATSPEER
jgi:hypothetical protein